MKAKSKTRLVRCLVAASPLIVSALFVAWKHKVAEDEISQCIGWLKLPGGWKIQECRLIPNSEPNQPFAPYGYELLISTPLSSQATQLSLQKLVDSNQAISVRETKVIDPGQDLADPRRDQPAAKVDAYCDTGDSPLRQPGRGQNFVYWKIIRVPSGSLVVFEEDQLGTNSPLVCE